MSLRLWEGNEFCGAIGETAFYFLAGHGGVVAGKDEVYRAGAESDVGVEGLCVVEVRSIDGKDAIQGYADAVSVVEAVHLNPASAEEAYIAQGNVPVLRQSDGFLAGEGICGVEVDGALCVADAHVAVHDVLDQAAVAGAGGDADSVVRAVECSGRLLTRRPGLRNPHHLQRRPRRAPASTNVVYSDVCIRDAKSPIDFDTAVFLPRQGSHRSAGYRDGSLRNVRLLGGGRIQMKLTA